jgi:hypothetical protein
MKEKQVDVFLWALLAFILFIIIIYWTTYITKNSIHVCESFLTNAKNGPNYSHNVDMPINTTISCKNMCGSMGRCYLTGGQCTSDVDCYGCQTSSAPISRMFSEIRGQNDAGKETAGVTPTYSTLTTDIGTEAKLYNKLLIDPPKYDIGVNTWRKKYDFGQALYDKRYYPGAQEYMPNYPKRKTLSGQFEDDGPLPSNAYM